MANTAITKHRLGSSGPSVPAVGLGLMGISVAYGAGGSDEDRLKLLDRAWELGCTMWDTADIYGDSEDIVGKWFKLHPERRQDIFLASKFGLKPAAGEFVVDSSPDYCKKCIDKSLERLGVDSIDLYYMHRADPNIPIEKTVEAMKTLVEAGKVKYLGLSEVSSDTLRRANAVHPIAAVQVEYNPWSVEIEGPDGKHIFDTCKQLGVSIFAYSPLSRGILTGRYRSLADFNGAGDMRSGLPRYQEDSLRNNLKLVDKFAEMAKAKGCTTAQLVLAWLVAQGENMFVIPGTKRIQYLEENFGASRVALSKAEEQEVRRMVSETKVSGGRAPMFGDYVDTVPLE